MEIKDWWPRLPLEAREHLKARLREPLDMAGMNALQEAGALPRAAQWTAQQEEPAIGTPLEISEDEWTWIEHYG